MHDRVIQFSCLSCVCVIVSHLRIPRRAGFIFILFPYTTKRPFHSTQSHIVHRHSILNVQKYVTTNDRSERQCVNVPNQESSNTFR